MTLEERVDKRLEQVDIEEAVLATYRSDSPHREEILEYLQGKLDPDIHAWLEFTYMNPFK